MSNTPPRMSKLSKEWIRMPVWAREDGVDVDLSADTTVKVAFLPQDAEPDNDDWVDGEWESDPEYDAVYARGLAGPFADGTDRQMWIKISGVGVSPEEPVISHPVLIEVY